MRADISSTLPDAAVGDPAKTLAAAVRIWGILTG
jgi:hypothetical protein